VGEEGREFPILSFEKKERISHYNRERKLPRETNSHLRIGRKWVILFTLRRKKGGEKRREKGKISCSVEELSPEEG